MTIAIFLWAIFGFAQASENEYDIHIEQNTSYENACACGHLTLPFIQKEGFVNHNEIKIHYSITGIGSVVAQVYAATFQDISKLMLFS